MAFIRTLLFSNPLRELVILLLDNVKQGRGSLVAKTVGATVVVVLISVVYSALEIQKRSWESGMIDPTDEDLMAQLLLQASLMVMADRLHYYITEFHLTRKRLEASRWKSQGNIGDKLRLNSRNLTIEEREDGKGFMISL